jgi:uncharacterized protein
VVELSQARAVAILTRAPASAGKSRLFAALGSAPDPALLSALLLDTLDAIAGVDWRRVIAVEPADACASVRDLTGGGIDIMPQPPGDLGARMDAVIRSLLDGGATSVALIGSDLPELTAHRIVQAFDALERDPAAIVLGPAEDGGYYLIAVRQPAGVFDGIAWGTDRVLAQTRRAAAHASRPVVLLDPIADVDTESDLRRVMLTAPGSRTATWARGAGIAE